MGAAKNKKKFVDINDEDDFPDLDDLGGGPAKQKKQQKAPQPQAKSLMDQFGFGESKITVKQAPKKNKFRPMTSEPEPLPVKKGTVKMQREIEEEEQKRKKAQQIEKASEELMNAKMAMMKFDSQPTKTKKQIKQDNEAFPSLEDELPGGVEAKEETKQTSGQAGKKGRKKGGNNGGGQQQIKLGFF